MRPLRGLVFAALAGIAGLAAPMTAAAQDVTASAPFDVSVTVYRNPYRNEGGFNLNYLGGFAFITETRRVVLTPGDNRLRFEGVADGIEPVSAIVTGLPSGVIEKNRDAMLLSPSALVERAAERGGRVVLTRTDPATGRATRTEGVIRAASDGVVFETADGIEALRCSGFAESFSFEASTTGLSATPTLSVRTRVRERVEAVVQLSYLARGFDWSADYVADRNDARTIDLGGWVTLANGNGVSFPNARVQVVAGRLNRQTGQVEPIDFGEPIIARCWPQGTTSDIPMVIEYAKSRDMAEADRFPVAAMAPPPPPPPPPPAPAVAVAQEELGDLKLYRVPDRSSVLARQAKQVRLMDREDIPVLRVYEADLYANQNVNYAPPALILRTQNTAQSNLGLPLPSGRVQLFETAGQGPAAMRLLAGETTLRDLAVDEETELRFGGGPDVQVRQILESVELTRAQPPVPERNNFDPTNRRFTEVSRIEVTNARPTPVEVEVRLYLPAGLDLARADRAFDMKNGRPIFRLTVPANGEIAVRYQTSPQ